MAELYRSSSAPHLLHRQRAHNSILTKDDVGKARPPTRDLPPFDFTYGCPTTPHRESVRDAFSWIEHTPSLSSPSQNRVDFQRLNKAALSHHATNFKQINEFRAAHPIHMLQQNKQKLPVLTPSDVYSDYAYGMRSRQQSNDIQALLANQFGNDAESEIEERYHNIANAQNRQPSVLRIKHTKYSKKKCLPAEPKTLKEPWKLSKFKHVRSRVFTSLSKPFDTDFPAVDCCSEDSTISFENPLLRQQEQIHFDAGSEDLHFVIESSGTEHDGKEDVENESGDEPSVLFDSTTTDEVPVGKPRMQWKEVKFRLTFSGISTEELSYALTFLAGCVRRNFEDSKVKVVEVQLESLRQTRRKAQQNYLMWSAVSALTPVTLVLHVGEKSGEELSATVLEVERCISKEFLPGVLEIRHVLIQALML